MTSKESKKQASRKRSLKSSSSKSFSNTNLHSSYLSEERLSALSARLPSSVKIKSLRYPNGEVPFLQVTCSIGHPTLFQISIQPTFYESGRTEPYRSSFFPV